MKQNSPYLYPCSPASQSSFDGAPQMRHLQSGDPLGNTYPLYSSSPGIVVSEHTYKPPFASTVATTHFPCSLAATRSPGSRLRATLYPQKYPIVIDKQMKPNAIRSWFVISTIFCPPSGNWGWLARAGWPVLPAKVVASSSRRRASSSLFIAACFQARQSRGTLAASRRTSAAPGSHSSRESGLPACCSP